MEQRYSIKFCVKLGKTPTETFEMLQTAYGSEALSRTQTFRWYKRFKEGREEMEDDPRSGRPKTSSSPKVVQKVRNLLAENNQMSIRQMASELGINKETIRRIIGKEMGKRSFCTKCHKDKFKDGSSSKISVSGTSSTNASFNDLAEAV